MHALSSTPLALALALVAGCTHSAAPSSPAARGLPPVAVAPTFTPYTPQPTLGRMAPGSVDFPVPHMRLLSGWGSMQRGVNVWVVSGIAEAYDTRGNYAPIGEVCSIPANHEHEQLAKVRDLVHCYSDKVDKGTYEVLGQSGAVARLQRSDGLRFTYDLTSGRLSPQHA